MNNSPIVASIAASPNADPNVYLCDDVTAEIQNEKVPKNAKKNLGNQYCVERYIVAIISSK